MMALDVPKVAADSRGAIEYLRKKGLAAADQWQLREQELVTGLEPGSDALE